MGDFRASRQTINLLKFQLSKTFLSKNLKHVKGSQICENSLQNFDIWPLNRLKLVQIGVATSAGKFYVLCSFAE